MNDVRLEAPIQDARPSDLAAIQALLAASELPFSDLDVHHLADFVVVRTGGGSDQGGSKGPQAEVGAPVLTAVAGMERNGSAALIRSVAVAEAARGSGLGVRLVNAVLERAQRAGVLELYLLTTTASGFFAKLGFEQIPREAAPAGIQASTEFAELCPSSAVCMRRQTGG